MVVAAAAAAAVAVAHPQPRHLPPPPVLPPFPSPSLSPPVSHTTPAFCATVSNGFLPGAPAKRSASRRSPHHLPRVAAPVVESAVAAAAADTVAAAAAPAELAEPVAAASPAESAGVAPATAAPGFAAARPSHRLPLRPFPFPSPVPVPFPFPSALPAPFLPFGALLSISTWPRGAPCPIAQAPSFQDPTTRPEHRLFFSSS